jgi:hypothetical protein
VARGTLACCEHLEAILILRAAGANDVTHSLAFASLYRAAVSEARERGGHFKKSFVDGSS